MKKSVPVTTLMATPSAAHLRICITALRGTPRIRPMSRRSIRPAAPMRSARPMKCSVSHSGHAHGDIVMVWEIEVLFRYARNALLMTNLLDDVRHPAAGGDRSHPQHDRDNGDGLDRSRCVVHVDRFAVHLPFERDQHHDGSSDD